MRANGSKWETPVRIQFRHKHGNKRGKRGSDNEQDDFGFIYTKRGTGARHIMPLLPLPPLSPLYDVVHRITFTIIAIDRFRSYCVPESAHVSDANNQRTIDALFIYFFFPSLLQTNQFGDVSVSPEPISQMHCFSLWNAHKSDVITR